MNQPEPFILELGGDERTGTGERVWVADVEWPPPEELEWEGKKYRRLSYSQMPAGTPNLIRAAKYLEADG